MTTALPPAETSPAVTARRQEAAAILRAVAGLLETRPDLPEPHATITIYLTDPGLAGIPAALAQITAALPGPWKATISRSASSAWLDLTRAAAGSTITAGTTVTVSTPAEQACAPAGTRTVTTWRPLPAVAALITDPASIEEER